MKQFGFKIAIAVDGEEALRLCRGSMPDLIILDHVMPRVDGLEFLRRLQRMRGGDRPVVLFCSGQSDSETLSTAIWEGAAECLVKPFDAELLAFKLQQVGFVTDSVCVAA